MIEVRVTEVSLSLQVARPPGTHVGRKMPYFVSALGDDTERVVPSNLHMPDILRRGLLPWWMNDPQRGTVRFVYSCPLQDVECSYTNRSSVMTFHGIKYKYVDQFNAHVSDVFNMLDTEPSGSPVTRYKAVARFDVRVPWDPDVLADIITNDPYTAQAVALCERTSTLGNRRLFSVVISVGQKSRADVGFTCRAAITYKAPSGSDMRCGSALAMMSKLPDEDASSRAADVLDRLFKLYESGLELRTEEGKTEQVVTGIGALRDKLPDLFVNNYTRECPVLPVMLSFGEAERQRKTKRVILYPSDGSTGRYYTAPDGYFVGLKRNRLANKDAFPCLVTCYLQDHMLRRGSETYRYYNVNHKAVNQSKIGSAAGPSAKSLDFEGLPLFQGGGSGYDTRCGDVMGCGKKRPLPKSIQDPSYRRKRASSFVEALELATGVQVDSLNWLPQLVRQELWDWSDEDIMNAVRTGPGSLVYRYFEEVIGVSAHVVVIRDGNFEPLVPRHVGRYVWAPPYPLHVVVFETYRTTYGERSCSYDYLTRGSATMFDESDSVVSYLTAQKGKMSVPPNVPADNIVEQTLDRNGKCSAVTTEGGSIVRTYTRPMSVPVTPDPTCFLDSHVRKMNAAKREMGLGQVDLSKRSNNEVLYFPNDASFRYVRESEKTVAEGLLQDDGMDGGASE